jgi:hypothetical protein
MQQSEPPVDRGVARAASTAARSSNAAAIRRGLVIAIIVGSEVARRPAFVSACARRWYSAAAACGKVEVWL